MARSPLHLLREFTRWTRDAGPAAALARVRAYVDAQRSLRRTRVRETTGDYAQWIARHEPEGIAAVSAQNARLARLPRRPLMSIVTPLYDTPPPFLEAMIGSVRAQAYPHWELCLADDASPSPHVREALARATTADPRIKAMVRPVNGHISAASNSALELATGEWVVLLDHDDLLSPDALLRLVEEATAHPDAVLIYSDEDKLSEAGRRYEPFFKPDFSPELFRSQNYLNHLTALRAERVRAVGGWREGFEGSQDYDLFLRVLEGIEPARVRHVPHVLYHWRAAPGSTALAADQKDYAFDAGQRALREHLARMGVGAQVERAGEWPFHRVRHALPAPAPLVSLVIPTRDRTDLLAPCLRSVLRADYPALEVLVVDNGSVEPRTYALFAELASDSRVRVLPAPGPFNYSALNNAAVREARGEVIGLLNNDLEAIGDDWLREMVSWAVQPEIGCVGAKLLYPGDTVQHVGVVLGIGGVAGHAHKHERRTTGGYFTRAALVHNVSAITGACLLVRRSVWDAAGGLDEALAVAFNDVDFCLRVRDLGYRNVLTPFAELYHHESPSRGAETTPEKRARFAAEVAFMHARWGEALQRDPYYSPHLSLAREDFAIRTDGVVR